MAAPMKLPALLEPLGFIEFEDGHRNPANRRQWLEAHVAGEAKMIAPAIRSRIEKTNELPSISVNRAEVTSLGIIA